MSRRRDMSGRRSGGRNGPVGSSLERPLTLATQDDAAIAPGSRADAPARTADGRPPPGDLRPVAGLGRRVYHQISGAKPTDAAGARQRSRAGASTADPLCVFEPRPRPRRRFATTRPTSGCARNLQHVEILPIDDLITEAITQRQLPSPMRGPYARPAKPCSTPASFFWCPTTSWPTGPSPRSLTRMQAGTSAVQAGNFQLDEEAAEPWLRRAARPTLEPRWR